MRIQSLASSSKGNCYFISDGSSHLLLECGIPTKKLRKKGIYLSNIDGCLITHEHQDHAKYAAEIAKYTKIYASAGTHSNLDLKNYDYQKRTVAAGKQFMVGTLKIVPFSVQHDAAEPVGYLIYSTVNKKRLLFATDTYYIHNRFKGLNYIMVECNFGGELLNKATDSGFLNKSVAKRYWSSHFELSNVIKFLKAQDLSKVEAIYLLHLSAGLSDAAKFKKEIMRETGVPVYVCEE